MYTISREKKRNNSALSQVIKGGKRKRSSHWERPGEGGGSLDV